MKQRFQDIITTEKDLRKILGHPDQNVQRKTIDHIDENCQLFIEQSPFVVISTSDKNSNQDASPKGDPAGFVKILDSKTLAIPDRLGNKRADTFTNILQNPKMGVIFFIPGIKETLRVNGSAQIVTDKNVLELTSYKGKLPNFAIILHVEEAFLHCSKCVIRSKLWANVDPNAKRKVPTLAKGMVDHGKLDLSYEEMDQLIKDDEKTGLY